MSVESLCSGFDAALVGLELGPVEALRPGHRAGDDGEHGEAGGKREEHEDRDHVVFSSSGLAGWSV